jgi:hypothetical protein
MTFKSAGKVMRKPIAQSGVSLLERESFCTTWQHVKPNCFTIIPGGENKSAIETTVAVRSK